MKVRFVGEGSWGDVVTQGASSLRQGKEYVVLEIYSQADGQNLLRVESAPGKLPGLFDSRLFDVVDSGVPKAWKVFINEHGGVSVCPEPWNELGFWEGVMDGEPWAVDVYRREKSKIELG